jgi:hypothetical protein
MRRFLRNENSSLISDRAKQPCAEHVRPACAGSCFLMSTPKTFFGCHKNKSGPLKKGSFGNQQGTKPNLSA